MGCTITAKKAQIFGKQAVSSSMQKVKTDTRINKLEKKWSQHIVVQLLSLQRKILLIPMYVLGTESAYLASKFTITSSRQCGACIAVPTSNIKIIEM